MFGGGVFNYNIYSKSGKKINYDMQLALECLIFELFRAAKNLISRFFEI
jgi:hypothetical protein